MINYNGTLCDNIEALELAMVLESEETKVHLRNEYYNTIVPEAPVTNPIKIYEFLPSMGTNKSIPPFTTNFVTDLTIKLHRKSILVKGECIREEFYQNYDGVTYSNLIVKEESTYTRDALGFPMYRTTIISWINADNTVNSNTKTWVKYYSNLEQISEGKVRRGNLVDSLQKPCIGLISIAMIGTPNPTSAVILEGRRFLFDYKKEFDAFVDESNREIVSCFSDSANARYATSTNYSWIDSMTPYGVTIRQFLIGELTI